MSGSPWARMNEAHGVGRDSEHSEYARVGIIENRPTLLAANATVQGSHVLWTSRGQGAEYLPLHVVYGPETLVIRPGRVKQAEMRRRKWTPATRRRHPAWMRPDGEPTYTLRRTCKPTPSQLKGADDETGSRPPVVRVAWLAGPTRAPRDGLPHSARPSMCVYIGP